MARIGRGGQGADLSLLIGSTATDHTAIGGIGSHTDRITDWVERKVGYDGFTAIYGERIAGIGRYH